MTKDEALDLALEALEKDVRFYKTQKLAAIAAIKQARALDKMADNARELGLDYEPDAYGYAKRLAEAIWKKHYKSTAPQWKPFDNLIGVLTQIDNMTSGLTIPPAQPTPVQDVDWKDQYEKQKRRAEMWIAKYEKDIGPLEKAAPAAQQDIQRLSALVRAQQITIDKLEAQRQFVGLTDEDKDTADLVEAEVEQSWIDGYLAGLKDAEAKLKEKNT